MNSIDGTCTNDILKSDPVDLESCFDPLFYPPEDFEDTMDNQRRENNPFTCMEEYKIGNTFYLVETECDGTEPLPYKLRRLIFSDRDSSHGKTSLNNLSTNR